MTNEQIIFNDVVAAGLLTEQEAIEQIEKFGELNFHTFQGWKARGRAIKKGSEAVLETKIWKRKSKHEQEKSEKNCAEEKNPREFYLAKAFLFAEEQTEEM